jgi:hypothetical protein
VPQTASVSPGRQTPVSSQQPVEQLAALHTQRPLTQPCPAGQATHAAPFAPHSPFVAGFTQVRPSQQPAAQSVGSQYATHA